MSKVKNNNDELTPYIVDMDRHYSHENKCSVGCGIGYSVRNHTSLPINVKSRLGFSQNISAFSDTYSSRVVDNDLKRDSAWLDVHLYFDDVNDCFNLAPTSSNTLDEVIIKEVRRRISLAVHSEYGTLFGFSAHFGICLNTIVPNYKNNGFQSDLFNIIIQYDTSHVYKDFLSSIPDKFIQHMENNEIDFSCATYQLTMLIDNHDECDNLWMAQAGKIVKIIPTKNISMSSGVYLFLNKYHIRDKPYIFISLDELRQNDNKLREYGLSYTEKEAIETTRTADYVELKKAYAKKESDHDKQSQTLTELKATHGKAVEKIEQVSAELATCTETKKQLTMINNGLNKDLERLRVDTEKLKKEITDKEDKNRDLKDTIRSLKYKQEIEVVKQYRKGSWFSHVLVKLGDVLDLAKRVGVVKTLLLGTG